MKTYRITMEIVLKPTADMSYHATDFIYNSIEEQLETHEQIVEYDIQEVIV